MTGHRAMQPIIDMQEKLRELAGKPKHETPRSATRRMSRPSTGVSRLRAQLASPTA